MTEPLAQINVTIGCQDNVGSGNTPVIYSDTLLLIRSQWGFMQADAYRQGGYIVNGLWKPHPDFCQGAAKVGGDCPATVHSIRATAGVKKWLVAIGISPSCTEYPEGNRIQGLMLWRWLNTRFVYQGLISAFVDPTPAPHQFVLNGDFAYCMNSPNNGWWKFDLVNKTAEEVAVAPADVRQPDIAGFTYKFEKADVQHMSFIREGAVTMQCFYPNDPDLRKQVASMIYNYDKWKKEHPGQFLPVPTPADQMFTDVPPSDQFYEPVTSLGMAGIVVGKPCP